MTKVLVTNALNNFAETARSSIQGYTDWMNSLADACDGVGYKFAIQHAAFWYIAKHIGTEFEFPTPDDTDPDFGCVIHLYPKEGDPTKWVLKIKINPDKEVKND